MDLGLDAASIAAMVSDEVDVQASRLPAKLLYTPAEAACCLAIGRTKLFELLSDGTLPSVKIGRARRVRGSDLAAFVDERGGPGHRSNRCVGSHRRCDVA